MSHVFHPRLLLVLTKHIFYSYKNTSTKSFILLRSFCFFQNKTEAFKLPTLQLEDY